MLLIQPVFYGVRFLLQNFNEKRNALRQHCFVLKICKTKRTIYKILQSFCNSKRTKRSHYDP